jgi:hypothetical protein
VNVGDIGVCEQAKPECGSPAGLPVIDFRGDDGVVQQRVGSSFLIAESSLITIINHLFSPAKFAAAADDVGVFKDAHRRVELEL